MRVTVRATEDAIIRLLKAGHPIPDHIAGRRWGEIRLPVFTRVTLSKPFRLKITTSQVRVGLLLLVVVVIFGLSTSSVALAKLASKIAKIS